MRLLWLVCRAAVMTERTAPKQLTAAELVKLLHPEFLELVLQWAMNGRNVAAYQCTGPGRRDVGRYKFLPWQGQPPEAMPLWADGNPAGYRLVGVYRSPA
jgi:hypothetical protein